MSQSRVFITVVLAVLALVACTGNDVLEMTSPEVTARAAKLERGARGGSGGAAPDARGFNPSFVQPVSDPIAGRPAVVPPMQRTPP